MRDLVPARTVRATVTEHGAMLLDTRGRGRWFALSPSGALWWQHLLSGLNVDEAAARVADHHGASVAQVQADMRKLAGQLEARKLLQTRGRRCPR